jgi:hypothetical protein
MKGLLLGVKTAKREDWEARLVSTIESIIKGA